MIPVISASCERSFSNLTHMKPKLRFTLKQDRLDDLMLPYIEQSMANNVYNDDVIQKLKN